MDVLLLSSLLLEHGYLAVFGVLLLCGLGLPIPEEITLVGAGVIVFEGKAQLVPMMMLTVVGILAGDSILFWLGRRYGPRLLERKLFRKLLHAERMAKVQAQFDAHALKVVFFARFVAGVRACVYFSAGTLGMKYRTFLVLDLAGALLSAPVSVWLGYHFGDTIETAMTWLRDIDRLVIGAIVVVVVWQVWKAMSGNTNGKSVEAQAPDAPDAAEAPAADRPVERPRAGRVRAPRVSSRAPRGRSRARSR